MTGLALALQKRLVKLLTDHTSGRPVNEGDSQVRFSESSPIDLNTPELEIRVYTEATEGRVAVQQSGADAIRDSVANHFADLNFNPMGLQVSLYRGQVACSTV